MSRTKPNRVYHKGWGKYGDILDASGNWITCRFDGEKGTNCYEVDAPYIEAFILEENPKPEPTVKNKLLATYDIEELVKDKERLDWLLHEYGVTWYLEYDDRITRAGIDKEMQASGYKNMKKGDK